MGKELRQALLTLRSQPEFWVYTNHLKDLLYEWGNQALQPGLPYEETESLRLARGILEFQILSLPEQATSEQKEEEDGKRQGTT